MRLIKLLSVLLGFGVLAGCDSPMATQDETPGSKAVAEMPELSLQFSVSAVGTRGAEAKSSSINTVDSPSQYTLDGSFQTAGLGYFDVTPPSVTQPGDAQWGSGTDAPNVNLTPSLDYTQTDVMYTSSGLNKTENLHPDFQTAISGATLDLQVATDEANDSGVSDPGDQLLQPVAKSGAGAQEMAAVQKNAPAPGQTFNYFKEQGYEVNPLGNGRFELRRTLSVHSGLPIEIEHIYNVREKRIERTRQLRDGQIVSERSMDQRKDGTSVMTTTHYGPDGTPASSSTMRLQQP